MNCDELKSQICAYFDDKLELDVRAAMDAHLDSCGDCTRYLALNRHTNCRDLADFLSEYIEGHLPIAQRVVFESHMAACPPCVDYMRSLQTTIEAGKQACDGEVEMPEKLVKAILKARKQV
jgi:anti-sigma factor RsiW